MRAIIRPLTQGDLPAGAAHRVRRVWHLSRRAGSGQFLGRPRLRLWPVRRPSTSRASPPTIDGELVGSNFVTRWGSVGFFGPMSVAPRGAGARHRQAASSRPSVRSSMPGVSAMPGCAPFRRAQCTWALWQIRLPRPLPDRDHGGAGARAEAALPPGRAIRRCRRRAARPPRAHAAS